MTLQNLNTLTSALLTGAATWLYIQAAKLRAMHRASDAALARAEKLIRSHAEECVPVLRPCEIQADAGE